LTVVTHELGHVLGFASIDVGIPGHDWMTATLATGTRRYPDPARGSGPASALVASTRTATEPVRAAGSGSIGKPSSVVASSPGSTSNRDSLRDAARFVPQSGSSPAAPASTGLDAISSPVSLELVDASLLDPVLNVFLEGRSQESRVPSHLKAIGNRPKPLRTLPALTSTRVDAFLEHVDRHAVLQPTEKSRRFSG
jgi:hypothetical protein